MGIPWGPHFRNSVSTPAEDWFGFLAMIAICSVGGMVPSASACLFQFGGVPVPLRLSLSSKWHMLVRLCGPP